MMRFLPVYLLLSLFTSSVVRAGDILDEEVPWSGKLRHTTIKEMIARMTGWAEGSGRRDFVLAMAIPDRVMDSKIDRLTIEGDPRPTYRDLLSQVLREGGFRGVLERGPRGIEVTIVHQRQWSVAFKTIAKLKRSGKWSVEGITKDIKIRGWKLSKHFNMSLLMESGTLIVRGTAKDCEQVNRYLSY